jgi:hypothetical protein
MMTVAVGEAEARNSAVQRAYGQATAPRPQQPKPVKMRYYGGPKSGMSAE